MKTRLASLLALVVTLSASALAASGASSSTDANRTPFGFSVSAIPQPDNNDITRGTTLLTVRRMMGAPQRQLSPDVWAYAGYHPKVEASQEQGCDTLIVTFTDGRVSDLKIVNLNATNLMAANLKVRNSPVQVAMK